MNERFKKQLMSLVRWNVSDLVASKLAEINGNSNCICWKVISFSWLHGRGDMEAKSPLTQLYLDEWLCYKLIPAKTEEAEEDLVIAAPGLSVWRKWKSDHSGDLKCVFSVIKNAQPGNFEQLVGVNAIIFPTSETLSLDIQKAELHNLVASLPTGSCIPLLVISDSCQENFAELSSIIVDGLGLNDLDKSRICRFLVICLREEGDAQFNGYFSDEKLKEGLMWLASESHSQPILLSITIRELVSHHLNSSLDMLDDHQGEEVSPSQCISAFNQALDQSINDIITASNSNPTGWPCPELFLMNDSTTEFRLVKQFLPTVGWSLSEEVGPLISSLRNSKLPSFSDDISWLQRCCSSEKEIEAHKNVLQGSLIRYLTQSSNLLNSMMATKEAHLLVQKYTRVELHGIVFKVIPSWVPIFRRVFNWQLNSSASFSCKAYVLEQSLKTHNFLNLDKLEPEVPKPWYISQPSLDEMVEVSCSPIISKRVMPSLNSSQKVASDERSTEITLPDIAVEERNRCSEIVVNGSDVCPKSNLPFVPKDEKKIDRLSRLLDQCSILQDEIEKKLSIYF